MFRKINKRKVQKAIRATKNFIAKCTNKERFTDYGLTIYGCEVRNLEEYKEMLGCQYIVELDDRLRELYRAI